MTLSELGSQFREARVHRGLLIEDVAKNLKISSKTLRAIEDGERGELPQLVFVRGFIKSYGIFLGFSQSDLQRVIEHLAETEPKVIIKAVSPDPQLAKENSKYKDNSSYKMIFAIILLAVIFFGGVFFYYNYTTEEGESFFDFLPDFSTLSLPSFDSITGFFISEPTEESVNNTSQNSSSALNVTSNATYNLGTNITNSTLFFETELVSNITDNQTNSEASNVTEIFLNVSANTTSASNVSDNISSNTSIGEESNVILNATQSVAGNISTNITNNNNATATDTNITSTVTITEGMQSLLVFAEEDCWIGINIDNKTKRDILLRKGNSTNLEFENTIELRLGNAGGVLLTHNGVELPSPGRLGQIATVKIP